MGWNGFLALMGDSPSSVNLSELARCGFNDYFFIGPFLNLQREAQYVIKRARKIDKTDNEEQSIAELALFRTRGLTYAECKLLAAYSDDFPQYQKLSTRIGKSVVQTRKMFSIIFNKMEVDNLAQIAHLLTVYRYNVRSG